MRPKRFQLVNRRTLFLLMFLLVTINVTGITVAQDAFDDKDSHEPNDPLGESYTHKESLLRPRTPPITFTSAIELPAPRSISSSAVLPMTSASTTASVTQMPTAVATHMPSATQEAPIFTLSGSTNFAPTSTAPARNPRVQPNSSSSKSIRPRVMRTTGEGLVASSSLIGLILIGQWVINAH